MRIFIILLLIFCNSFCIDKLKNKIIIDTKRCTLFFTGNMKFYKISVGYRKDGKTVTPIGKFEVIGKSKNPPCNLPNVKAKPYSIDKKNPYGKYFIGTSAKKDSGFNIGIHGTNTPEKIGKKKYISGGCIRMRNEDIGEIFDLVKVNDRVIIK